MTINGAIMQLVEMRENSMMPMVFKPYFDKVIETISECEEPHSQPQWVPCSERLPKYEMDVLLQFNSNMCVGYYHPSESWIIWSGGTWCTGVLEGDEEPIAWMPLPECYRGDENVK